MPRLVVSLPILACAVAFAASDRAAAQAPPAQAFDDGGPAAGFSSEPAISGDGARVVYSELERTTRLSRAGRPLQRIVARSLATGRTAVVSLSAGGRQLTGWSGQPQTIASPAAPLGGFSAAAGAMALHTGDARLCSLAPPAW